MEAINYNDYLKCGVEIEFKDRKLKCFIFEVTDEFLFVAIKGSNFPIRKDGIISIKELIKNY